MAGLVRVSSRGLEAETSDPKSPEWLTPSSAWRTSNGPSFYRYSRDGYGETYFGGRWQGQGIGRLWAILAGERGEYEMAAGHDATRYLGAMLHFANHGGMIPEQIWDRAEPTLSGFCLAKAPAARRPFPGA